ncbi:hypothetical protein KR222_005763 [Zaprionus bogoriensis]|nr:hypothetical protein KR222_005763 [Zaprionus bogoriensis]
MLAVFSLMLLIGGASAEPVTNVQCEILDISHATFPVCNLKLIRRGVVALNIHMKFKDPPTKQVWVNLSLWRKFNGYRPFMYNVSFNFCTIMDRIFAKKISFETIFFSSLLEKSNLNHTCPYDHDVIVKGLIFKEEFLKLFPLPSGAYKYVIMTTNSNHWQTKMSVHIIRKEDLMKS